MYDNEDDSVDHSETKARILCRLLTAGEMYRNERFGKTAKTLEQYDFTEKVLDEVEWDTDISFNIKVRKTSQFKREIGSRLFNANPTFRVSAQPWSQDISKMRSSMMEAYLNYCTGENDFFDTLDDGLINGGLGCGLGVFWTGLHPVKDGVVTTNEDSWDNLVIDPDAKKWPQVQWVARKRLKPRWWLIKQYPEHKADIALLHAKRRRTDDENDIVNDENHADTSTDMVVFYEVWMRTGLHNYRNGGDMGTQDDPKKYIVAKTKSSGKLLWEGDWETPLHLDGRWPCVPLSFFSHPHEVWPISPLEPGIPWLRAMNVIATMMLAKYRVCDGRTLIALIKSNGTKLTDEDEDKILYGTNPVDVISPIIGSVGDDPDVRKVVQTITLQSNLESDMGVYAFCSEQFEKETGLYEFLFTGQADRQDRSAMATEVRDRNTRSRIDFMKTKLDQFLSTLGRQLALTARFHVEPEEVAKFLGPQAGQMWGRLMSPEDMDPQRLAMELTEDGIDPMSAMMQAEQIISEGTTYDEWRNEIDYGIEVGSTVRRSPEAEREANELAVQQIVPVLLQQGQFAAASLFIARQAEMSGASVEDIDLIKQSLMQIEQQNQAMQQQQVEAQQAQAQQAAEAQAAQRQQQMAMEERKAKFEQAKMQRDSEIKSQELERKIELEVRKEERKLAIERERFRLESELREREHSNAMEIANKQSDTQQRQIESQVMTAPSEPSVPSVVNVNVTPTETTVENTIVNEKKAVMAKILDNGDIKLEPQG